MGAPIARRSIPLRDLVPGNWVSRLDTLSTPKDGILRLQRVRHSRLTIGVDNRSPGGLYNLGDACVAPTRIYRPHRAWDAPVGARSVPPDGGHWRRGQSSFRRSPFRRGVRGIPSQQSGSMVVHLEVFTTWATHASPLHGSIDPTAPGMHPSAPVPFLRRGDIGEGDSHHLGGHHLGAVSGAFPVNNRGRWWFTWRSLPFGEKGTGSSTPPRLGCPRRRPFRSSGEGTLEKGTVIPSQQSGSRARPGEWGVPSRPYTDLSTPPRLGCTRREGT